MAHAPEPDRLAAEVSWQLTGLTDREEHLRAAAVVLLELFGGDLVAWNSDVTDRRSLQRTKAYDQILAPIRADHQISVLTARLSASSFHAWGVTRTGGRDFDDDDVRLAERLQPLLGLLDRPCTAAGPPTETAAEAARVGLSPRETEVLRLLGRGLTATAIARVLRISERTVRKHLEHVYRKTGCHDRVLATRWARDVGFTG